MPEILSLTNIYVKSVLTISLVTLSIMMAVNYTLVFIKKIHNFIKEDMHD